MKKVLVMSVVLATLVWTMGLATFVPAVSAATLTAGDLIKGSGSAVYFYAADGKRYTFPTLSTYMTWYSDFSKVKTITDSELAAISLAGNVVVRPGTKLIKIDTVPKVFAVEPKGKLVWVASEAVANTLYGADWAKRIVTIPDGFWTNYTDSGLSLSGTTYPEGQLVKWAGSTNVYYVTGGKKALVSTDAAFAANMWKTADVVTAPAAITLAEGTAIAGVSSTLVDVSQGGGAGAALPTGTGTLTVALAGDTPAASPVADASIANFVKFGLTANGAAMTVSRVVFTKGGYSATADVENLKITDLSGVPMTNSASLNSNGTSSLTFSPALSLAAGETRYFYLRSGVVNSTTAGKTISFGIASSADVSSSAATVAGNFPVLGNAMSVVGVDIGTAKVYQDGTVSNSTPDAGDENVVVNRFKVEAGSVEAITIESITLMESGSASMSDIKNIELWSVTQNKTLGEVASYNVNGKVSFGNLNIVVAKGETHRFQVRLDIVKGAGETVNSDLVDSSDVLMSVKGNAYGFYITPTAEGGWTGVGSSNQVINAGSLNISKATTTPATGKVAEAADQVFTVWDFEAKGEPVRVSAFTALVELGTNAVKEQLTSCKLVDAAGTIVAGPLDAVANGSEAKVTFTDTFVVPVGTSKYSMKCRVYDSGSTNFVDVTTFQVGVKPDTGVTAKGDNTNDAVDFTAQSTTVNGNVMTVAAVKLVATTLGTPAAQLVAAGTGDFLWATMSFDASNSGENVTITSVDIKDTVASSGLVTDIDNAEVWCDLTSASSERGDIYEKKVSGTENFAVAVLTLDFVETVTVTKNSFVKCAVVADLGSGAENPEKHQIDLDAVTASGVDTGATPTVSPSGAGQQMTVAGSGSLTVSFDTGSPKSSIFISSEAKQTLAVLKLAADSTESLDLDELNIADAGSGAVATYYLYSDKRADGVAVTEPIATAVGTASPLFVIPDGRVTVPSGSSILLTVKGDINYIDGATIDNGDAITLNVADGDSDVLTTGLSSGEPVTGANGVLSGSPVSHYVYEARPVFSKDSTSPSGSMGTGADTLVAVFKIDNSLGTKKIVMSAANDNDMVFTFKGFTSGQTSCGSCDVIFRNMSGDILGTTTGVDLTGSIATTANLAFVTNSLNVPAGGYELIKVYANTTDFITASNSLQVSLDDASAANFSWGIDSSAGIASLGPTVYDVYETAEISWRGDITANTLNK